MHIAIGSAIDRSLHRRVQTAIHAAWKIKCLLRTSRLEHGAQLARLVHLHRRIAAADELTLDEYL
jgi:hypothetical protein